jgi:hypothetical protein
VDSDWDQFVSRCEDALGDLVEGRPEPFKALWSRADDVVSMGAFGGHERDWDQVSARLDWATAGIKATDRVVPAALAAAVRTRPPPGPRPSRRQSARRCRTGTAVT